MVNNSDNKQQWKWLFETQPDVWANQTIMTVSGNHDTTENTFANHFHYLTPSTGTQSSGSYYSYTAQNAHFVMLNTNDIVQNELNPVQVAWLKADIQEAKAAGVKWVIVMMHKGTQTVANHITDSDVVGMRKQLQPIFAELGVDVVLQGHDHTYARTNQMGATEPITDTTYEIREGVKTAIQPKGTVYLTANSSGTKFYSMKSDAEILANGVYPDKKGQNNLQMFSDFTIEENRLLFTSYEYDAVKTDSLTVYDQYAISKVSGTNEETGTPDTNEEAGTSDTKDETGASNTNETEDPAGSSSVSGEVEVVDSSGTEQLGNNQGGPHQETHEPNSRNQKNLPQTNEGKETFWTLFSGIILLIIACLVGFIWKTKAVNEQKN